MRVSQGRLWSSIDLVACLHAVCYPSLLLLQRIRFIVHVCDGSELQYSQGLCPKYHLVQGPCLHSVTNKLLTGPFETSTFKAKTKTLRFGFQICNVVG